MITISYSLLSSVASGVKYCKSIQSNRTNMKNGVVWYKFNDLRVCDHIPLYNAHDQCNKVLDSKSQTASF